VRALGAFDVGQAVIVSAGELIAVEAAEGTDQVLARVARLRSSGRNLELAQGVLIKRPKPGQELRVDLPAIGPDTVSRAAEAQLAGIAVLAGQALAASRAELATRAAAKGLFVYGFTEGTEAARKPTSPRWLQARADVLGQRRPSAAQLKDMRKAASALASLIALTRGGAAVVSRGHILGIETRGAVADLFARATRNRQWGEGRWRWRTGVGVLSTDTPLTGDVVAAAREARFAGLVLMAPCPPATRPELVAQANVAGLFLVQLRCADG
jgi:UDP-2,3-diacylglucosamine hydrolase